MYFGRGAYDPVAQSEAQTRLQGFQGATSISSNQYFGREEDEAAVCGVAGLREEGGQVPEEERRQWRVADGRMVRGKLWRCEIKR